MSQVVRIPSEVFNRLEAHAKGFDTPANVINMLLDHYEGVERKAKADEKIIGKRSNMSRGEFVRSHGATCKNWNWSWSFINNNKKFIIFGAWDNLEDENGQLILTPNWETNPKGRKNAGYTQALEHLKLIEEEGYQLKTFRMFGPNGGEENTSEDTAKIESIESKLEDMELKKIDYKWYAV